MNAQCTHMYAQYTYSIVFSLGYIIEFYYNGIKCYVPCTTIYCWFCILCLTSSYTLSNFKRVGWPSAKQPPRLIPPLLWLKGSRKSTGGISIIIFDKLTCIFLSSLAWVVMSSCEKRAIIYKCPDNIVKSVGHWTTRSGLSFNVLPYAMNLARAGGRLRKDSCLLSRATKRPTLCERPGVNHRFFLLRPSSHGSHVLFRDAASFLAAVSAGPLFALHPFFTAWCQIA